MLTRFGSHGTCSPCMQGHISRAGYVRTTRRDSHVPNSASRGRADDKRNPTGGRRIFESSWAAPPLLPPTPEGLSMVIVGTGDIGHQTIFPSGVPELSCISTFFKIWA